MSQLPANTSGGLIHPPNTSVARVPFTYEKDGYSRERYQGYDYSNNLVQMHIIMMVIIIVMMVIMMMISLLIISTTY